MSLRTTARYATLALVAPLGLVAVVATSAHAADAPTCDGKAATIVVPNPPGNRPTNPVTGTPGEDVIVGTPKGDVIDGAGGNDIICGLAGADKLIGGDGDDRLFGGRDMEYTKDDGYYGDLLVPGPGDDHADLGFDPASRHIWGGDFPVYDQVSYADAAGPVRVDLAAGTATGQGTDTIAVPKVTGGIIGTAHADTLIGSVGHDTLDGGAGDDTISGGPGDDDIHPDSSGRTVASFGESGVNLPGNDSVHAGPGKDVVQTFRGVDQVDGGADRDVVWSWAPTPGGSVRGGSGNDYLDARPGTSVLGGRGRDELVTRLDLDAPSARIDGGPGRDQLDVTVRDTFEPGMKILVHVPRQQIWVDDTLYADYVGAEKLVLHARAGRLTFIGGSGPEDMYAGGVKKVRAFGGRGNDTLAGSDGKDLLVGGPGRDRLTAYNGKDRVFGGKGNDRLDGGKGRDRLAGGKGYDRCLRGERVKGCEVRR